MFGKRGGRIRKALVTAGFLALFAFGYLATSVMTSCKANALLCCQMPCINLLPGTAVGLAVMNVGMVAPGIAYAAIQIGVFYGAALLQFTAKVFQQIGLVIQNWVSWWDTFWYYDMQPALQDMTKQLALLDATQARQISQFKDAVAFNKAISARLRQQQTTFREVAPGENVCVAGSLGGGMTQAKVLAGAYSTASSVDRLRRSSGAVGTVAAGGSQADIADRYNDYRDRYCAAGNNRGVSGCAADAPFANKDLDVPGQIFLNATIDMKSPDMKRTVDDLITNIAEPMVRNPLPSDTFGSARGKQIVLDREGEKARRQGIVEAMQFITGRRAPGSGFQSPTGGALSPVGEINEAAGLPRARSTGADGLPALDVSPSENEVLEALAIIKNRAGDLSVRQVDDPENNAREAAIQAGIRTRQLNAMLGLTDRLMVVVAGQVGSRIARTRPQGNRADLGGK